MPIKLKWKCAWDGEPRRSMKVCQLLKNDEVVAYVKQQPGEQSGSEYAYIGGTFQPVIASRSPSVGSIKKGLERWARGRQEVQVITD